MTSRDEGILSMAANGALVFPGARAAPWRPESPTRLRRVRYARPAAGRPARPGPAAVCPGPASSADADGRPQSEQAAPSASSRSSQCCASSRAMPVNCRRDHQGVPVVPGPATSQGGLGEFRQAVRRGKKGRGDWPGPAAGDAGSPGPPLLICSAAFPDGRRGGAAGSSKARVFVPAPEVVVLPPVEDDLVRASCMNSGDRTPASASRRGAHSSSARPTARLGDLETRQQPPSSCSAAPKKDCARHGVGDAHQPGGIAVDHASRTAKIVEVHRPQHFPHLGPRSPPAPWAMAWSSKDERIAYFCRRTGDQLERLEPRSAHPPASERAPGVPKWPPAASAFIEPQAARQHRHRDLLQDRWWPNEFDVVRRFFSVFNMALNAELEAYGLRRSRRP